MPASYVMATSHMSRQLSNGRTGFRKGKSLYVIWRHRQLNRYVRMCSQVFSPRNVSFLKTFIVHINHPTNQVIKRNNRNTRVRWREVRHKIKHQNHDSVRRIRYRKAVKCATFPLLYIYSIRYMGDSINKGASRFGVPLYIVIYFTFKLAVHKSI